MWQWRSFAFRSENRGSSLAGREITKGINKNNRGSLKNGEIQQFVPEQEEIRRDRRALVIKANKLCVLLKTQVSFFCFSVFY